MTTEKPLIEKIINIPNEDEHNFYYFLPKDVAHDIGRLKAVFKDGMLFEGGSIKKIIDEIIGELGK